MKRTFYCRYEGKNSQSHLGEYREGREKNKHDKQTEPDPERKEMESSREDERREDQEGDKNEKHIPEMARLHK